MAVNTGDVIRTTVEMLFDSVNVQQNVFHIQYTGATISSDQVAVNAIRAELETALYSVINSDQSTDLSFQAYTNFNVSQDAPMPDAIPVTVLVGVDVGEPLPLQVAGLLSFPTATARSIGRKYLGAYTESSNDGAGVIQTAAANSMIAAAGNLVGTFSMSIGTGLFGNFEPITVSFRPWTSSRIDVLFRTQRRRVSGVGV